MPDFDPKPRGKGRAFRHPCHEWLRIAAMVDPDWEMLRALTQEPPMHGMEPTSWWRYLYSRACEHQLDGVYCWRVLDPRFAEWLPHPGCRAGMAQRRDVLNEKGKPFWESVGGFCNLLAKRGVPYAVRSGPVQYLPLGIPDWPREWTDVEVEVNVSDEAELDALAAAAGARVVKWWPSWWQLHLPGGARIDLGSARPVAAGSHDCRTWGFWRRPPVPARAFGVDLYLLDPVLWVLDMAWCTWNATFNQAGPWPLWALARIKARVEVTPGFDWDALGALLRENVQWSASVPLRDANLWQDSALRDAMVGAWCVLWVLRMADRVYGLFPPGGAEALIAPFALREPEPFSSAGRHFDERDGAYTCGVYRWKQRPSDEDLLFHHYTRGVEGRLARGLWEEVPEHEHRRLRVDERSHWSHEPQEAAVHADS